MLGSTDKICYFAHNPTPIPTLRQLHKIAGVATIPWRTLRYRRGCRDPAVTSAGSRGRHNTPSDSVGLSRQCDTRGPWRLYKIMARPPRDRGAFVGSRGPQRSHCNPAESVGIVAPPQPCGGRHKYRSSTTSLGSQRCRVLFFSFLFYFFI